MALEGDGFEDRGVRGSLGTKEGGAADFLRRGRGDAARSQFRLQDPLSGWFHRPGLFIHKDLGPTW